MSKNIEIQINTGSNTYETLYPKTLGSLVDGTVENATNLTGTINASKVLAGTFASIDDSNGYIFPSNVRIKNGNNFGMKLNFGDGDYVYLYEDTDDNLTIKAKRIELTTTASPGITNNGSALGGSGYTIEFKWWIGTGNSSGNTTLTFSGNLEYVLFLCGMEWGNSSVTNSRDYLYLPFVNKKGETNAQIPQIYINKTTKETGIGYVTASSAEYINGKTIVVDNSYYNSIGTLTYCVIGFIK